MEIDGVKAVGILCVAYIAIFTINYGAQGRYREIWQPDLWETLPLPIPLAVPSLPYEIMALIGCLVTVIIGLVMARTSICLFGWIGAALLVTPLFSVPSFTTQNLGAISLMLVGLGLPFLLLLEIILTVQAGTAKARVVFRPRPLGQIVLLAGILLGGLLLAFSYLGVLQTYGQSPEAATYQTAMMAGISTIILTTILLRQPGRGPRT